MLGLVLAGCESVNHDYPREASSFIPEADDAELDLKIAPLLAGRQEGTSGFYLLGDGIDAAAVRLRLIKEAQRSIDLQYYLIKRDQVGQALLYALLKAADRGVRVRLLLDDLSNKGFDHYMMALDAHPDFEIRVFNPFNRGFLGRSVGAVINFRRVNRRMHNKSFTVDNRATIIGGRNIADEYFGVSKDSAFDDLDVIGIGPVVQDVADMFDTYWQHKTAVPLAGFIKPLKDPQKSLDEYRERLAEVSEELFYTRYAKAVIDRAYIGIKEEMVNIRWSPYKLIFDPPDKGIKNKANESELITVPLAESLLNAEQEAMIVSPYFVPRRLLMKGLIEARSNGIEVSVITNSLMANDVAIVHSGYAPSRKPLLEAGVKLYEVKPDAHVPGTEYVDVSSSRAVLHTKAYVLDRREVFIGSFNFDPRSAYINTEMGVLINDPELGASFVNGLEEELPGATWEVSLTDRSTLEWNGFEDNQPVTFTKEPMTSWWQRAKAGFYRILPIRSQL